jgi:hypothetical protein
MNNTLKEKQDQLLAIKVELAAEMQKPADQRSDRRIAILRSDLMRLHSDVKFLTGNYFA